MDADILERGRKHGKVLAQRAAELWGEEDDEGRVIEAVKIEVKTKEGEEDEQEEETEEAGEGEESRHVHVEKSTSSRRARGKHERVRQRAPRSKGEPPPKSRGTVGVRWVAAGWWLGTTPGTIEDRLKRCAAREQAQEAFLFCLLKQLYPLYISLGCAFACLAGDSPNLAMILVPRSSRRYWAPSFTVVPDSSIVPPAEACKVRACELRCIWAFDVANGLGFVGASNNVPRGEWSRLRRCFHAFEPGRNVRYREREIGRELDRINK